MTPLVKYVCEKQKKVLLSRYNSVFPSVGDTVDLGVQGFFAVSKIDRWKAPFTDMDELVLVWLTLKEAR